MLVPPPTPPFLPPGKGKWDTRQVGQGNPERVQKNSPSLSNSIRGHGPREVMSQLYKPPVLLAFCSGRATARGAPTSNLLTKQRICRFELNTHVTFQSVRTRRYWGYSLSRSPLILCQFRWWGRTKAEPCDTHTHTKRCKSSTRRRVVETRWRIRASLIESAALCGARFWCFRSHALHRACPLHLCQGHYKEPRHNKHSHTGEEKWSH